MGSLVGLGNQLSAGPGVAARWRSRCSFAIGIPLCTAAGRALGGKKDNQAIIWDEIVTVPDRLSARAAHELENRRSPASLLHRLFDITKPPPARQLEHLPDGLGVMADDLVAAIYACVSLLGLVCSVSSFGWTLLTRRG